MKVVDIYRVYRRPHPPFSEWDTMIVVGQNFFLKLKRGNI